METANFQNQEENGMIILKSILLKQVVRKGVGLGSELSLMTNLDISFVETCDCLEYVFTDFLLLLYSSPYCCTISFSHSTNPLNIRLFTLVYFVILPVILHISTCPSLSLLINNVSFLALFPTALPITTMYFFST